MAIRRTSAESGVPGGISRVGLCGVDHHDEAMAVATDSTVLGDFDDAVFEQDGITEGVAHRAA